MSSVGASGGRDRKREASLGAATKASYGPGGHGDLKRGPCSAVPHSPTPKERKSTSAATAAANSAVFYGES